MKKLPKKIVLFALIFILSLSSVFSVYAEDETDSSETVSEDADGSEEVSEESEEEAQEEDSDDAWPEAPEILSSSVLVMDSVTGAVFYSLNADEKVSPASTTKLLTCLIALEYCSLDETITYSETAVDLIDRASNIGAVAGEEMSLEDCLYGLMLPSGNECANAIAEHISGSIDDFVELMNEYAAELGCTNTHFSNPSGLYASDHYTTAEDMYLIAQAAFANSTLVDIISQTTYTIAATNMSEEREVSTSNLLIDSTSTYYNSTVVGGKTGYTSQDGRALVILSENDNMHLICLFFDCIDYYGVFTDAQSMLDYVYNNFSIVNISEQEIRFSSAFSGAQVELDSTASIVIPNSMTLSDLDSEIIFATDMDAEEFGDAKLDAGITTQDGRHLYASIKYYYGENYLGNIYVILNDNLEISAASFAAVYYVDIWDGIMIAAGIIILLFIVIKISKARGRKKRLKYVKKRRSS